MRAAGIHRDALVLAIKDAIIDRYEPFDWIQLGYSTGCRDYVQAHRRLLRSLRFNDDDYPSNVLSTLEHILAADHRNINVLLKDYKIRDWLRTNRPELFVEFVSDLPEEAVTAPTLRVTSSTVERAISDAESLIRTNGPTSGVDRIHTALHGYLIAVCEEAGIAHGKRPTTMELFSLIRNRHAAFRNAETQASETVTILRSLSRLIDTLNSVRNEASLAHSNDQLLDEPEAFLMINAARTVLHYLDAKLARDHSTSKDFSP